MYIFLSNLFINSLLGTLILTGPNCKTIYLDESKKFRCLAGCGIKSMRPIFKTEMFIYQSKANLDEKILFGKIKYL